jgi:two-component system nitrate/nitrite response regulator NarL
MSADATPTLVEPDPSGAGQATALALALADTVRARGSGRVGVALADPDPVYRIGLERIVRAWPEFELLACAESDALIDVLPVLNAQVLVVDHTTIGMDRSELINRAGPHARLLLMCTRPEPAEVYTALADGASGFLAKGCSEKEVAHAIAALGRGGKRIGASVQRALGQEIRLRTLGAGDILSAREREILLLMCEGLSGPMIAKRLCVGLTTVKTHQHSMYEKLGATDRAMAVARAFRRHVIE